MCEHKKGERKYLTYSVLFSLIRLGNKSELYIRYQEIIFGVYQKESLINVPFINIRGESIYYRQNAEFLVDRATVIFVHGAGGTWENWTYQLRGIEGYNLIALDLPGHGRSGGAPAALISQYSDFIKSFVQALTISRYVIVGHSMGGAVAMEFALAYPDDLKGLIIVNSGAKLRVNPETLEVLRKGEHPIDSVRYRYSTKVSESVLQQSLEEMKLVPTEVYLADFMACNGFNILERVKTIKLPALVICGDEDQLTPVKYSEYLAHELTQSTLSIIMSAGHMSMLEQPDSVNQAIHDFLSDQKA